VKKYLQNRKIFTIFAAIKNKEQYEKIINHGRAGSPVRTGFSTREDRNRQV
jgi:hypothetical protein